MFLEMARWWTTPEPDESFLQFRERSVRDGAWLTYVVALVVAGYALATWDGEHRRSIVVLIVIAVAGGYLMSRLPVAGDHALALARAVLPRVDRADVTLVALVVAPTAATRARCGRRSSCRSSSRRCPIRPARWSSPACCRCSATSARRCSAGGATAETIVVFCALLATATVMGVSQAVNRERQRGELQLLSRSDPLTGALNRRGFTERFAAELSDHVRHDGRPLGLIVIDLDDFKRVNDTRGHAAGDDLLREVADTLAADLRPSDVLGRLGGDEFAVLLPQAGPGELRAAAARLEQRLGGIAAASIGLAALPGDGLCAEDLHRAADADLYRAKRRARTPSAIA